MKAIIILTITSALLVGCLEDDRCPEMRSTHQVLDTAYELKERGIVWNVKISNVLNAGVVENALIKCKGMNFMKTPPPNVNFDILVKNNFPELTHWLDCTTCHYKGDEYSRLEAFEYGLWVFNSESQQILEIDGHGKIDTTKEHMNCKNGSK